MYVAWYINKQLLDVCSMICKQKNYWMYVAWYVNKKLVQTCKQQLLDVCSMIYKQTITGCM